MTGRGIDAIPLKIPDRWDPVWFETFIRDVLALADVRNATEGVGISIAGAPEEPATISASADIEELATASLLTATSSSLSSARRVTAGVGIDVDDNGGGSTFVISVKDIPFGTLLAIPPNTVIGNASASDDRPAATQLTVDMAPDGVWTYAKIQDVSTDARVLGLDSGAPASMKELTLSEVLDFIGSADEGDILYRGASGWERLPRGDDGDVLTLASGVPAWAQPDSLLTASYVTADNETTTLVNSRQLLAGTGIDLDSTTPGELTIENLNP